METAAAGKQTCLYVLYASKYSESWLRYDLI